jgi:hypothetical protein
VGYEPGTNKIFYQAAGFKTGITVTIKFWEEKSGWSSIQTLIELGEGVYLLDYCFSQSGPYLGLVFENGIPIKTHVFRIERESGIRYYLID